MLDFPLGVLDHPSWRRTSLRKGLSVGPVLVLGAKPSKGWGHQREQPGKEASTYANLQLEVKNHAPAALGEDSKAVRAAERLKQIQQPILITHNAKLP